MTKLIKSLQSKIRKRKVLRSTLSRKQENNGVINLHRMDSRNAGDWYCAPHHYFEELTNSALDIFDYKREDKEVRTNFIHKVSQNSLIIGGGGLLNRSGFSLQMKTLEKLPSLGKKTVLWGVGHNEKSPKTFGKVSQYSVDVNKFGLAGTRDYTMPGEFVPCVSCMHPLFDQTYQETQEFGIILHKDTLKKPKIITLFKNYPSTSNTTDIKAIIEFIGASQNIVTDSYHAMYWSMLMGKKVVVIPNSSKFYDFKYQPVISNFYDAVDAFAKAETFPTLLAECRSINRKFADKAFDYLNL